VGFKLCIGHREEFLAICKAMLETGIKPDFYMKTLHHGNYWSATPKEKSSDWIKSERRQALMAKINKTIKNIARSISQVNWRIPLIR